VVTLREAVIEGNRDVALTAFDATTSLTLEDALVRRTASQEATGIDGRGLAVQDGAEATFRRVVLAESRAIGIFASATNTPGTRVVLEDVVVEDTLGDDATGIDGRALNLQRGATLEGTRVLLLRSKDAAAFASESTLGLTDVTIRDVASELDGRFGRGIALQLGSGATLERVSVESVLDTGLYASAAGTTASLTDVAIRGVAPRPDGSYGRGVDLEGGPVVTGMRVLVEDGHDVGLYVNGAGTSATLTDATIRRIAERGCATTTCADAPAGMGIGAYAGAAISLERFVIDGAALCGVHVESSVDLRTGEVRGSPVGACVQVDGYDTNRLSDGVSYTDNDLSIDARTLPVPEPNVPSEEP
jgi:hypothetical protein